MWGSSRALGAPNIVGQITYERQESLRSFAHSNDEINNQRACEVVRIYYFDVEINNQRACEVLRTSYFNTEMNNVGACKILWICISTLEALGAVRMCLKFEVLKGMFPWRT